MNISFQVVGITIWKVKHRCVRAEWTTGWWLWGIVVRNTGLEVETVYKPWFYHLKVEGALWKEENKEGESMQDLEVVTIESREVGNIWVKALGLNVNWRFIFQKTVGSRWRQILSCGKCSALRWGQVISLDLDMRSSTLSMALLSRNINKFMY